jgi:hypothetical protein
LFILFRNNSNVIIITIIVVVIIIIIIIYFNLTYFNRMNTTITTAII